jgi:hypothetical protein
MVDKADILLEVTLSMVLVPHNLRAVLALVLVPMVLPIKVGLPSGMETSSPLVEEAVEVDGLVERVVKVLVPRVSPEEVAELVQPALPAGIWKLKMEKTPVMVT